MHETRDSKSGAKHPTRSNLCTRRKRFNRTLPTQVVSGRLHAVSLAQIAAPHKPPYAYLFEATHQVVESPFAMFNQLLAEYMVQLAQTACG